MEILRAQQLDPVSLIISTTVAEVFYFAGDYDRAITEVQKVIEMDPNFPQARWRLAQAYEEKGMQQEAVAEYLKWTSLTGASSESTAALLRAYKSAGMDGFWRKFIALVQHNAYRPYISSRKLASMFARVGEKDQAVLQLEKALHRPCRLRR
jgi:predicted Zn-dependent protease